MPAVVIGEAGEVEHHVGRARGYLDVPPAADAHEFAARVARPLDVLQDMGAEGKFPSLAPERHALDVHAQQRPPVAPQGLG